MWRQNSSRAGGGPSNTTSAPTCMCEASCSWARNEASMASGAACGRASARPRSRKQPARPAARRSLWVATILAMKPLAIIVGVQVSVGLLLIALVATDNALRRQRGRRRARSACGGRPLRPQAGLGLLREQVKLGPRPAGSDASRALAERLRELMPAGASSPCPGGLRNVIGTVPGRGAGLRGAGGPLRRRTFPASWAPTTAPRAPPGHGDRPAARAPAAHDPVHPLRR